jgi:transcriptional regulator with XRE-family HTH domain
LNIKERHIYLLTRKEKKISLREIANELGDITISALAQYERGEINLKSDKLNAYRNYILTHDNRKDGK